MRVLRAASREGRVREAAEVEVNEEKKMSAWPQEELCRMAESDDLHVAPFREDGRTYGTPTWIWSVVVDGSLYVRAYNGTGSSWYRAAVETKGGAHHDRRHDEGSELREGRGPDE
jgi:hypothetical protein